jgi:hypothetical protein
MNQNAKNYRVQTDEIFDCSDIYIEVINYYITL